MGFNSGFKGLMTGVKEMCELHCKP